MLTPRLRITPLLSYQERVSVRKRNEVWIIDPKTGAPELVPNDNYVNPGYNYYFLEAIPRYRSMRSPIPTSER